MFQFTKPMFIVRDPQLIKKLTVKDFDFFTDHRVIFSEDVDPLFGKALLSLQGQKWKGAYVINFKQFFFFNHAVILSQICAQPSRLLLLDTKCD
jgi:hypothetical protein